MEDIIFIPGLEMRFLPIPEGSFWMGTRYGDSDEEPMHRVYLSPFWMLETVVTQGQFAAFTQDTGLGHKNGFHGSAQLPATRMSWNEAMGFCDWLTKKLPAFGRGEFMAKLPTEAQWEYACRAGSEGEYFAGDGVEALRKVAWFEANSEDRTHPVKEMVHSKNPWGLYGMHGNVREWCLDGFDREAYRKLSVSGSPDPEVSSEGNSHRVLRGGSYNFSADWCRSAARNRSGFWNEAGLRDWYNGFRVVLVRRPVE